MPKKKQTDQRSSRRKSAQLTSVIKPSHSFPDLSLLEPFEHDRTNNTFIKKKVTAPKLDFYACSICSNMILHDDNRLTKKISFSDLKLKTSHLNSSIEQFDKSSLNPLTNEHRWVLQKTIQNGHNSTKKHSETSLNGKSPF